MSDPISTPVFIARSAGLSESNVANSLAAQMPRADCSAVLFFCSTDYDLAELATAMSEAFADTQLIGCTTAGEITPIGYERGSVCAVGFHQDWFQVNATLLKELTDFDLPKAQVLLDELLQNADGAPASEQFVLTLFDGLSSQEEQVLALFDSVLGRIAHFGGSAGDDIRLATTHVFYQGAFHSDAAVFMWLQTQLPFEVFSTHHLTKPQSKLVVTAAESAIRTVYELNAMPAAQAYADLIGCAVSELTPAVFALNPLAVKMGDQFYVRSIQCVNEDLSLTFYCAIGQGMVLTAMQGEAILPNLEQILAELQHRLGAPLVTLGCDCFLRRLEFEHYNQADTASEILRHYRVLGFNTYGEHFDGVHINQTFTGVYIGQPEP